MKGRDAVRHWIREALLVSACAGSLLLASCGSGTAQQPVGTPVRKYSSAPAMSIDVNKSYTATIDTNRGKIVVTLLPKVAPITVNNFVYLARQRFYDGLKWHRVVANFVIQGGDPAGNGSGGPGYQFQDEPVRQPYAQGIVAMANAGPNTNGSQFFICLENLPQLPPAYTIFGQTKDGMDVVKKIQVGDVMNSITIEEK
jgi:cyclophilin family peptidyl-prolyl cis-trans isomerase